MTAEEANAEAQKRWGPTGGAGVERIAGKPNRYVVGCLSRAGNPYRLGEGESFEVAFHNADELGHTSEAVQDALSKAEAKARREAVGITGRAFLGALGALFGGGR